ncbi:MAG TPA: hypothetical protein VFL07_15050, partial [Rudaea sp.]|nr:hypothetical protein [Rudaea sp.]
SAGPKPSLPNAIAVTCACARSQEIPYQSHSVPGAPNVNEPEAGQLPPSHQFVLALHPSPFVFVNRAIRAARSESGIAASDADTDAISSVHAATKSLKVRRARVKLPSEKLSRLIPFTSVLPVRVARRIAA